MRVALAAIVVAATGAITFAARAGSPGAESAPAFVVAIDPGHGGSNLGATAEGLLEKNVTLALARGLRGEGREPVSFQKTQDRVEARRRARMQR